jgi:formate-dependent nitrite reductase membrane component NrfD
VKGEDSPRTGAEVTPDAVAASLGRNDGGFGRAQDSYYGQPVLHRPHWRWEIITYFWLGGIMSASGGLSVVADRCGGPDDAALVRSGRYLAFAGAGVSGALLVKDLGRPERFVNMLRILKFGSPMSVGSWTLAWFSVNAGLAVADQLARDGIVPEGVAALGERLPAGLRDAMLGVSSAIMAFYTGVLISATAIPAWYRGRWFIPAIFVSSACATACSANALLLSLAGDAAATRHKLERLECVAGAAELLLLFGYERASGKAGQAFFGGEIGKRVRTRTMLAGIALPLALNLPAWFARAGRDGAAARGKTIAAALLALYGGYVLRESFIKAGRVSADDPKPVLQARPAA